MLLDVEHRMRFHYDGFVHQSWLELRVEPRSFAGQSVESFFLSVGPPSSVAHYLDWNGNVVHHFGVADYHDRIEVVAQSTVDVHPAQIGLEDLTEAPARDTSQLLDFAMFGGPVVSSPELAVLGEAVSAPATAPIGEQVAAIGSLLEREFEYRPGVTDSRSTTSDVLDQRSGVCQDFAHLMIGLLRLRGVPARYVSGYLHVQPKEDEPSQSHAWVELFTGERGWVAFDPTHNRVPNEQYVRIGAGRHYDDVPPNRGVFRGNAFETLEVQVRTQPGTRRDAATLQQLIGKIDVPVYREQPNSFSRDEEAQVPDAAGQQQQ